MEKLMVVSSPHGDGEISRVNLSAVVELQKSPVSAGDFKAGVPAGMVGQAVGQRTRGRRNGISSTTAARIRRATDNGKQADSGQQRNKKALHGNGR
ncbi:hypothetical protein A0257_21980 [Hymenobacter psoromatis]|nr:hypothetical protein A0257_21980 [Hymenobacter psoromatis]